MEIQPIAHIETAFGTKFGVPRQSGVVDALEARVVLEPKYRVSEALRGMEGFTHLWLIWGFSEAKMKDWNPTVRPPRLGGNVRMGVFATRSPFRPNSLGLSSVRLVRIEWEGPDAPALIVAGADLMNGTPIYDIKPYLPYTDSHPEATGGFTDRLQQDIQPLQVIIPPSVAAQFSSEQLEALRQVLAHDPRPHYQQDPHRIYGMEFAGVEVKFYVEGEVLTVLA